MKKYLILFTILYLVSCSVDRIIDSERVFYKSSIDGRQDIPSFILIGDTQRASNWEIGREKNDVVRPIILKKIAEENPAFIIHLGDFGFMGSNGDDWTTFDSYASDIRKNGIPLFPVLGNHEYFGNNKKALDNYFFRFPQINQALWYSFSFRGIGFILLNSNFNELSNSELSNQNNWYSQKLNEFQMDTAVKTIIVCCHHAPYTNSTLVNPNEDVQKYFVKPMLDIPKAKLFFTGHCHSYEHFEMDGKHFVVSGGGSGPRQKLRAKPIYKDTFKGGRIRNFHYCKLTIKPEGLLVQMLYVDEKLSNWDIGQEFLVGYDKD